MSAASPALAVVAGVLSVFSPCVLPILPLVLGSAAARHRWAPVALALGLAASFTLVGLFVALAGYGLGLDADTMRTVGGAVLFIVGTVLVTPVLRTRLALAAGPVASWGQARLTHFEAAGLWGQAGLGAGLGLVWTPCVGPTL